MSILPSEIYHLLYIEDSHGKRLFHLNAATYKLGRDITATIRIFDKSVSRHHASLLRLPNREKKYSYRLVDGNTDGKPSTNGITVNESVCRSKELEDGDVIKLGKVTLQYLVEELAIQTFESQFKESAAIYKTIQSMPQDSSSTESIKYASV